MRIQQVEAGAIVESTIEIDGLDSRVKTVEEFDVLTEIQRKLLVKAVDDKIKQVLFLYLAVCFGRLHILPKQTFPLIRCDRLRLRYCDRDR